MKLLHSHAVVIFSTSVAYMHNLALCNVKLHLPFVSLVTEPIQILL